MNDMDWTLIDNVLVSTDIITKSFTHLKINTG
jgi:hypothetical protein